MITSLTKKELLLYLEKQLDLFFPDKIKFVIDDEVRIALDIALMRVENCFKHITLPGYKSANGDARFSHIHTDQYSQFLYYFSNTLWEEFGRKEICDKIIALNKLLNGLFYSYKCKLPDIFLFGHPVGSIIGNAEYSNYLVIFQNVTINTGQSEDGKLVPKLGEGLFLGAGAKIIGNKTIGNRVSLGVDTLVYNQEIPDDSVIIKDTLSGKQIVRQRKNALCKAQQFFDITI